MMQTGMVKQGISSACHTYIDGTKFYFVFLNTNLVFVTLYLIYGYIKLISFNILVSNLIDIF